MVSKARLDLPDPETPVTTVSRLCGISKSMFLRLWTRAPRTTMDSVDIWKRVPQPVCSPGTQKAPERLGNLSIIKQGSVQRGLRRDLLRPFDLVDVNGFAGWHKLADNRNVLAHKSLGLALIIELINQARGHLVENVPVAVTGHLPGESLDVHAPERLLAVC